MVLCLGPEVQARLESAIDNLDGAIEGDSPSSDGM
jgi:hypothetical protein